MIHLRTQWGSSWECRPPAVVRYIDAVHSSIHTGSGILYRLDSFDNYRPLPLCTKSRKVFPAMWIAGNEDFAPNSGRECKILFNLLADLLLEHGSEHRIRQAYLNTNMIGS